MNKIKKITFILQSGTLKSIFDFLIALIIILFFSPVILIIGILIKLDSNGPIFFQQSRLGLNLIEFNMLKFRTMVVGAQDIGTGLNSYGDDPRVTRLGKTLRKLSLDELPQLLNVLFGQMSIVGPRPPVVGELDNINLLTSEMYLRFTVKPGITGLAQISGRNLLSWPEKIKFDNLYINQFKQMGLILDIKILVITIFRVVRQKNIIEQRGSYES